mmetsp:Transcript_137680/g.253211  ORF Transcript_137680/g.253211 Transcript_137680/m.253211 type:complete len:549 (+) Transcript_137680:153-1799(+)
MMTKCKDGRSPARSPRSAPQSRSSSRGKTQCCVEYGEQNLHELTDRLEQKVGHIPISGRYHRKPRILDNDYGVTDQVLGSGYNGAVRLATSKERPDHKFAVKAFDFTGVPAQKRVQLESEIEVFLTMDHPHIARLVDVYEAGKHLDLVMECMEGGELLDRVREKKRFSEAETAVTVWQMLLALNYIHSHGMIHCDLKLENYMYDSKDGSHLKLIDFGFSKMCDRKSELRRKACGTLSYTAPEVLEMSYTQQCDQWSLGVIVFVLLSGYMPFSGSEYEQMTNIRRGSYVMKTARWGDVGVDAKSFTEALLQVDPKKRLTAESALNHPFIASWNFEKTAASYMDRSVVAALRDYGHQSRFRRVACEMMAWALSTEERAKVDECFIALDENHTGAISFDNLKKVMVDEYHLSPNDAKNAFHALDPNDCKEVHYSDFLAAMVSNGVKISLHEELLMEAFRKFDTDNSGYITAEDLRTVLGDSFDGCKVEKLINEADAAQDGCVSYHEFAAYLTGNQYHCRGDESAGIPSHAIKDGGCNSCVESTPKACCTLM